MDMGGGSASYITSCDSNAEETASVLVYDARRAFSSDMRISCSTCPTLAPVFATIPFIVNTAEEYAAAFCR